MTWQPGRDKIAELLEAAELQQVTADLRVAHLLLDDAGRHVATAATASSSGDLSGAYQLAYDALRKSATSLLAMQGLRATSRGGHHAVQEAAQAQFGSTVKAFRSFGGIRRARNNFEYPSTPAPGPSPDDVRDAIATATQAHDAALMIPEQNLLTPWRAQPSDGGRGHSTPDALKLVKACRVGRFTWRITWLRRSSGASRQRHFGRLLDARADTESELAAGEPGLAV